MAGGGGQKGCEHPQEGKCCGPWNYHTYSSCDDLYKTGPINILRWSPGAQEVAPLSKDLQGANGS